MFMRILMLGACTVCLAGPALAEVVPWKADLDAAATVPANDSKATGHVEANYDTETKKLSWKITYSGLTGPATAAHVHGPAMPGKTAAVLLPISNPQANPIEGSATLTSEQADALKRGVYVDIHTKDHPDGEIRGELK
jgi:hypothetical protein